ncbi:MAG TPA: GIY-YIG nuclease family protein [Limnochordia bacterium]
MGALGTFTFPAGLYAYVGSAQRHREARLARHLRRDKRLKWHIDYFRAAGEVRAVTRLQGGREAECRLASLLAAQPGASLPVARFGASDCRCPGHLIRFEAATLWIPGPLEAYPGRD